MKILFEHEDRDGDEVTLKSHHDDDHTDFSHTINVNGEAVGLTVEHWQELVQVVLQEAANID